MALYPDLLTGWKSSLVGLDPPAVLFGRPGPNALKSAACLSRLPICQVICFWLRCKFSCLFPLFRIDRVNRYDLSVMRKRLCVRLCLLKLAQPIGQGQEKAVQTNGIRASTDTGSKDRQSQDSASFFGLFHHMRPHAAAASAAVEKTGFSSTTSRPQRKSAYSS